MSESTRASRLYWWTAEYGLVGTLERPRLYGAGLLSSIGESSHCLTGEVEKVPFSLACVEEDFDITRMQPQLFVARDFDHLFEVLEAFEATLAWKRGGDFGLEEARRARTVNHLLLPGGRELTGQVESFVPGPLLAVLEGPLMASREGRSLSPEPGTGAPSWRSGRPARRGPGRSNSRGAASALKASMAAPAARAANCAAATLAGPWTCPLRPSCW